PLYGLVLLGGPSQLAATFWRQRIQVAAAIALALLTFSPQLFYWKATTGHWLYDGYKAETFHFAHPELLQVFGGVKKGLFFWAPVLLLALPGFCWLRRAAPSWKWAVPVSLLIQFYLVSSWWEWGYGWTFGHRAFVEFMPLFALGLAATLQRASQRSSSLAKATIALALVLICLNAVQSLQYALAIVPPTGTTWEKYTGLFLDLSDPLRYQWRH